MTRDQIEVTNTSAENKIFDRVLNLNILKEHETGAIGGGLGDMAFDISLDLNNIP